MSKNTKPRTARSPRAGSGRSPGKPRSFGQQWMSKGDSFTRSVAKTGGWTLRRSKGKPS